MVLGILAEGESYGYAILRRINELSGGELDWTEGLLYPLLHRLERLGYVESSWQSVTGERRRKCYRTTDKGLAELAEQRRQWDTVVRALMEVWLGLGAARRPLDGDPAGAAGMTVGEGQEALEAQFAQWRLYVQRRRELQPSDADELEDHLRGSIDGLLAVGLSADEAFLVAVKRMGSLDELSREFARASTPSGQPVPVAEPPAGLTVGRPPVSGDRKVCTAAFTCCATIKGSCPGSTSMPTDTQIGWYTGPRACTSVVMSRRGSNQLQTALRNWRSGIGASACNGSDRGMTNSVTMPGQLWPVPGWSGLNSGRTSTRPRSIPGVRRVRSRKSSAVTSRSRCRSHRVIAASPSATDSPALAPQVGTGLATLKPLGSVTLLLTAPIAACPCSPPP